MAETRLLGGTKQRRNYWERSCPLCGKQNLMSKKAPRMICKGCGKPITFKKGW